MKSLFWQLAMAGAFCLSANVVAAQKTAAPSAEQPVVRTQAYLGVGVEPLHSSLVNRISSLIGGEYGVLVDEVAAGSPAATGGLKPGDVICKYDDQKVFNAEQLVRLIRGDKPGREVMLGIIRDGKQEDIKLTLGEQEVLTAAKPRRTFKPTLTNRGTEKSNEAKDVQWKAFDALTLTQIDGGHFKAEIKYRDEKGKIVTRTFQGTHDEIAKAISEQKDMPAVERNHLLRALDMPLVDVVELEIPD
jgi:membrane-associated protease RseP (regulator of RpoE activity)